MRLTRRLLLHTTTHQTVTAAYAWPHRGDVCAPCRLAWLQVYEFEQGSWHEDRAWSALLDADWKLQVVRDAAYKALAKVGRRRSGGGAGGGLGGTGIARVDVRAGHQGGCLGS